MESQIYTDIQVADIDPGSWEAEIDLDGYCKCVLPSAGDILVVPAQAEVVDPLNKFRAKKPGG